MLSAIVDTRESERGLVRTLAALVPGATTGLLAEVIVADGGSNDDTEAVADIAGCRYLRSQAPQGVRLKEAAEAARTHWLLFLRAGSIPEPGWIAAVESFIEAAGDKSSERAAVFRAPAFADSSRPGLAAFADLLRIVFGHARPEQGLLIAKQLYRALGGHPHRPDADAALLRKLGRRRIVMLATRVRT